jgi:hypothetical protein
MVTRMVSSKAASGQAFQFSGLHLARYDRKATLLPGRREVKIEQLEHRREITR